MKNERPLLPDSLKPLDSDEDFFFEAEDLELFLSETSDISDLADEAATTSQTTKTTVRPTQARVKVVQQQKNAEFRLDDFDWTPDAEEFVTSRKTKKSGKTTKIPDTTSMATTTLVSVANITPVADAVSKQKCRCVNELGEEVPMESNRGLSVGQHPLK